MTTNYNPSEFGANVAVQVIVDASHNRTGEVVRDIKNGGFIGVRYSNIFGKRDQDRFNTYAEAVRFAGGGDIDPPAAPLESNWEFEFDSYGGKIARTPNKGGMADGVRFGIFATAKAVNTGGVYRLNIYENRDGSIDVVVHTTAKNGTTRTLPEYQMIGLRNVARSVYQHTFWFDARVRRGELTPCHKGTPRARVVEIDAAFGLIWDEPAAHAMVDMAEARPAAQTVYVVEGEHFSQAGRILKVFASEADATREAVELVNIQLKDSGWTKSFATADNWRNCMESLQDYHGAQYCYVEITAHDVIGAAH